MKPRLLAIFAGLALLQTAARAETNSLTFKIGNCCTDASGTDCASYVFCIDALTCADRAPYLACPGNYGLNDGVAWGIGSVYPPPFADCDPTAPGVGVENSFDARTHTYTVRTALLKWDTSKLATLGVTPAMITGAQLHVDTDNSNCTAGTGRSVSDDDLSASIDWYNWDAPVAGCDETDYDAPAMLPALSDLRIRGTGCYQVNLLRLANAQQGVRVDGTTYLRLSIPSAAPPTGTNVFAVFSVESRYIPAELTVYWERPAAAPQPGR